MEQNNAMCVGLNNSYFTPLAKKLKSMKFRTSQMYGAGDVQTVLLVCLFFIYFRKTCCVVSHFCSITKYEKKKVRMAFHYMGPLTT